MPAVCNWHSQRLSADLDGLEGALEEIAQFGMLPPGIQPQLLADTRAACHDIHTFVMVRAPGHDVQPALDGIARFVAACEAVPGIECRGPYQRTLGKAKLYAQTAQRRLEAMLGK